MIWTEVGRGRETKSADQARSNLGESATAGGSRDGRLKAKQLLRFETLSAG